MSSQALQAFLAEVEAGGEQDTVSYALGPFQALTGDERKQAEDLLIERARRGDIRAVETLGLGGFDQALPEFERYLAELGTFEKNRFEFPSEVVEAVNRHWGFALDAFGYDRIQPGEIPR